MVVILGEATQASGDEIGQAMKSLEVRLLNPKTVSTLQEMGIQVMKNKDQFLSFKEIMNNVGNATKNLSDDSVKLNDIMTVLGGTWRRNWAEILTGDWDRFEQLTSESANSFGYSVKENEKVLETFDAQIKKFQASMAEVFISMGQDGGILDSLKNVLKNSTSVMDAFSRTSAGFKKFLVIMVEVTVGVKLLSIGLKGLTGVGISQWLSAVIQQTKIFNQTQQISTKVTALLDKEMIAETIIEEERAIILEMVNAKMGVANVKTSALNTAQKAMTITQKGLMLSTMALTIALSAGVLALTLGFTAIANYNAKQKELEQQSKDFVKTKQDEIDKLIELKDKYNDLQEQQKLGVDIQTDLKEVEQQIIELMPERKQAWEDEKRALTEINGVLDEQIKKKQNLIAAELRSSVNKVFENKESNFLKYTLGERNFFTEVQNVNKYNDAILKLNDALKLLRETRKEKLSDEDIKKIFGNNFTFPDSGGSINAFSGKSSLDKFLDEYVKKKNSVSPNVEKDIKTLVDYYSAQYNVTNQDFLKYISDTILEGQILQSEQAIESVFKNYDSMLKEQFEKKEKIPDKDPNLGGSVYTPQNIYNKDTLRKLLDADQISLKEYVSQLKKIRDTEYASFAKKTPSEINAMLLNPTTKEKTESYLTILKDIENAQTELDKKPASKDIYSAKINQFQQLEDALSLINYQLERNNILTDMANSSSKFAKTDKEIEQLKQKKQELVAIKKVNQDIIDTDKKQPDYGKGNVDLNNRPMIFDEEGYYETVYSSSRKIDGKEVLLTPILPNGKKLTDDEFDKYIQDILTSGKKIEESDIFLGSFDTIAEAEEYAQELHENQAKIYDKLFDAKSKISDVDKEILDLDKQINEAENPASESEKINLLSERVKLLKQEQVALHNINEARRGAISQNVSKLSSVGFEVSYDSGTNQLIIRNMERLNQIQGKTIEETNELRKKYEELIKETISLNDANQDASSAWWSVEKGIRSTNLVIQDLYKTMRDARISIQEDILDALRDIYTKEYEANKEKVEKQFDLEIDNLNRIKNLNSRNRNEQKFKDDQKERYEELAKLQEKYRKILLDPTALKERIELEKQIAEKTKEIKEAEIDNNLELEDNRIDDLITIKQDEKKRILDADEERYKEIIADASNFSDDLQDVMDSGQQGILAFLMANSAKFKAAGQAQGQALVDGWKEKLELLKQEENLAQIAVLNLLENLKIRYEQLGNTQGANYIQSLIDQIKSGKLKVNAEMLDMVNNLDKIMKIIDLKMRYAVAKTQAEKNAIKKQADDIRATMPSELALLIGSDVSLDAMLQNIQTILATGLTGGTTTTGTGNVNADDENKKNQMKDNSAAWKTASPEDKIKLANENMRIGTSMGWRRDPQSGIWYKSDGTRAYDKGGLTYGKGLMLKNIIEPERTLSPQQTKSFDRLVDIMGRLPELRTPIDSRLSSFSGLSSNAQSMKTDIKFDGDIIVQVTELKDDADYEEIGNKVFGAVRNKMNWVGIGNVIQKR